MTIADAIAQAESVAIYQRAANRLEARSWTGDMVEMTRETPEGPEAIALLTPDNLHRLATLARFAERRNRDGAKPDKWERTP